MYNLVLLLPLLSACLLKVNKNIGILTTSIITVGFMGLSFLCACFIFYNVALTGETLSFFLPIWTWLDLELLSFSFGGFYDTLSAVMLVVVTCMSLCIHTYSLEYMKNDPHLQRFLCYLSLFTFGMLVLVTSNNLIQLFFGWELIGIMSYLLINFWYTRIQANKGAIQAVLVNRVGDTAFAIAIFLIFRTTGSVDFDTVFLLADQLNTFDINLICFFLFLAAVGKSAQLGLHTWLPNAMEGPTPVSALLHSSTMVFTQTARPCLNFAICWNNPIFLSPTNCFTGKILKSRCLLFLRQGPSARNVNKLFKTQACYFSSEATRETTNPFDHCTIVIT